MPKSSRSQLPAGSTKSAFVNAKTSALRTALKERERDMMANENLKSCGSLLVVVIKHTTLKQGSVQTQQKMVVMRDDLKYKDFPAWLGVVLWGDKARNNSQIVCVYKNELGADVTIADGTTYAAWIDSTWYKHPCELMVYDKPAVLAKASRQWSLATELFELYDVDGNGKIDLQEALMATQMTDMLDLGPDEVGAFWEYVFEQADVDKDQSMSFDEFVTFFNQASDQLVNGLLRESRATYRSSRLQYESLRAHSWRVTLREAARRGVSAERLLAKGGSTVGNLVAQRGILPCDANARRDSGVELRVPEACLTDSNADRWVQVETWLEELVDGFEDGVGTLGVLMSPVVHVALEAGTGRLAAKAELTLPHAFEESMLIAELRHEDRQLDKRDLIVAYSSVEDACWQQLGADDFELIASAQGVGGLLGAAGGLPGVRVLLDAPGVYAVFSMTGVLTSTRLQAVTLCNSQVVPLEKSSVRLHFIPDLPSALDRAVYEETAEHGLVRIVGWCEQPLCAVNGKTQIDCCMWDSDDHNDKPRHRQILWGGEACKLEFELWPEDWYASAAAPTVSPASDAPHWRHPNRHASRRASRYDEQVEVGKTMEEEYLIRLDFSLLDACVRGKPSSTTFTSTISAHNFPPPGPPTQLKVEARTSTAVHVCWTPPRFWGGCALKEYELQLAHISLQGTQAEWITVDRQRASSFRNERGQAHENVSSCRLRVRAFNCGTAFPGAWSDEVLLLPEKRQSSVDLVRDRAEAVRKPQAAGGADPDVQNEDEIATVREESLAERVQAPWNEGRHNSMERWSAFRSAIGHFYLRQGVHHGVHGELFEMTPKDVEEATVLSQGSLLADGISLDEPLVALANSGVWVLQTLAHFSDRAHQWVPLLQSFNGLLHLASFEAVGELAYLRRRHKKGSDLGRRASVCAVAKQQAADLTTEKQLTKIIETLIDVQEALRQSAPGGYVAHQLNYRYAKHVRQYLEREWQEHLESLQQRIGAQVMDMMEVHAKGREYPTATEAVLMKRVLRVARGDAGAGASLRGALAHKAASFHLRIERLGPTGAGRREIVFFHIGGTNLRTAGDTSSGADTARSVTFHLDVGEGQLRTASTLGEAAVANAKWVDQRVLFELSPQEIQALPSAVAGRVELANQRGDVIGRGSFELDDSLGTGHMSVELAMESPATSRATAAEDGGTARVNFLYTVGAWVAVEYDAQQHLD